MRDHRKLDAFLLATDLVKEIYRATARSPAAERFGLLTQIRRAAISLAANIVEGSAHSSQRNFVRFLDIAFSSARELGYYVTFANRLGFLSEELTQHLEASHGRTCAALAGLLRALRS